MLDYILSRLRNEVDLHFKLQHSLQYLNKTDFTHMDIKKYDLLRDYIFYCNLHDKEINTREFNGLLDIAYEELEHLGYNSQYNTDTELLEIYKYD